MAPKSSQPSEGLRQFTREEVGRHDQRSDRWLVIEDRVYDVTRWGSKHPGGSRLLSHYAGQDATEAFKAFHASNPEHARKFLKSLLIGEVTDHLVGKDLEMVKDFEKLRVTAHKMDLFQPSFTFYGLVFLHILLAIIGSYTVIYYYGATFNSMVASLILATIAQAQLNWLQHDIGHLSVFKRGTLNRAVHLFLFAVLKGVSPSWWNHMHYQHHSKPNVIGKDPDVRLDQLFVVGETLPVEVAQSKKNTFPYNWQHHYFFVIGPPLLFPIYFQFMTFYHTFTRRLWGELFWKMTYYTFHFTFISWHTNFFFALAHHFLIRLLESHWFTWVSQSNHIPMEIKHEDQSTWLKLQLSATCNVERSLFNDWFTGHLNFQAEHHLFPTMPRHNLYKIAPLVKSLCEKHGVAYHVKPLGTAFGDIFRSLKKSGELWLHAYEELHT